MTRHESTAAGRAERLEELFHEVIGLAGAARREYLDEVCAGDPTLRAEIEELLVRDEEAESFFATPAREILPAKSEDPLFDSWNGKRIGPYRLERRLAVGGMSAVYEAIQQSPQRTVALKLLRPELTSTELLRRFHVEAEALALLQHPAIAHVYDAGVAELDSVRVPYIVMELVPDARTITEYADEHAFGTSQRIELFAEVCAAVQYGHQRGVIHRDLKPGNILVDGDGHPKLIDFGIARMVKPEQATQGTASGMLLGTIHYMSPEQCEDARRVDTRSDVYALGVVLYELLVGKLPYELDGLSLARATRVIQEVPPRRPSTVTRALRGDIETIVLKALEKVPERRYQSTEELRGDLLAYLKREPISARPPTWNYQFRSFARRHRILVGSVAAVLLVSLAATLISTTFAIRAERSRRTERFQSYVASIAAVDASLRALDVVAAERHLAQAPPELRGWEWDYLESLVDLELLAFHGPTGNCHALAWNPRRSEIVSAWNDGARATLIVVDTADGEEVARSDELATNVNSVAIHVRGDLVAWGGGSGEVGLWDPYDARMVATWHAHDEGVTYVGFDADGELLITSGADGRLRVWSLATKELVNEHALGSTPWNDVALLPGGRVAAAGEDGAIHLASLDAGGAGSVLTGHFAPVTSVAADPDGGRLVSGSRDGTVRLWDLASGKEVLRLSGHRAEVLGVAFHPSGNEVLSTSSDRTIRIWNTRTGSERLVLYGHEEAVNDAAYAPGGDRIVSGAMDGTIRIWSSQTVAGHRVLGGHQALVRDVAFDPTGRLLASASFDGLVRLFDAEGGALVGTLVGHEHRVMSVAFDPTRSRLATGSNDKTVRIWDLAARECSATLEGSDFAVHAVTFSPDGALLAAGSADGTVTLRETESWHPVASAESAHWVNGLAFAPDGRRLAGAFQDGTLVLWSVPELKEVVRVQAGSRLECVAFDPTGLFIATGAFNGELRLWHPSGEPAATLRGHSGSVAAVAFHPDGARLASASSDHTVRLWHTASARELLTLRGHQTWVFSVAFSPDGSKIVSAGGNYDGGDLTLRIWGAALR